MIQKRLSDLHRPQHVDGHDVIKDGVVDVAKVLCIAATSYASIVDQHIDGCALQLGGEGVDLCMIGDVRSLDADIVMLLGEILQRYVVFW